MRRAWLWLGFTVFAWLWRAADAVGWWARDHFHELRYHNQEAWLRWHDASRKV